jgi:hypothetical protein
MQMCHCEHRTLVLRYSLSSLPHTFAFGLQMKETGASSGAASGAAAAAKQTGCAMPECAVDLAFASLFVTINCSLLVCSVRTIARAVAVLRLPAPRPRNNYDSFLCSYSTTLLL